MKVSLIRNEPYIPDKPWFHQKKTPPLDKSGWLAGWLACIPDKTRFNQK